jgi:hypothetical protein
LMNLSLGNVSSQNMGFLVYAQRALKPIDPMVPNKIPLGP